MDIGGIVLENPFFAAPLAGVTDSAMRRLNKEFGASLVFSEMISCKGLIYHNKGSEDLLSFRDSEEPLAYQIFGSDPEIMWQATKMLNVRKNKIIDINMGCPVPKVVKNGEGSALLKDERRVYDIVKSVVEASTKPVTVKIRLGWDDETKNYLEIAKTIEKAGAEAITLHGRTRKQYYSGKADWNAIKELKEAVKIKVVGNGDIFSGEDALKMIDKTNCDFVMIGRGMLGNPWIFSWCNELWQHSMNGKSNESLTKRERKSISIIERGRIIKKHLKLLVEIKGEERGVKEMRKHIAWYTKGMPNSSFFRNQLNQLSTEDEAIGKIDEFISYMRDLDK